MKLRWAIIAALITAASAVPSPAMAQDAAASPDVSRAEGYAAEAFEAYERQEYQEAVVLYLKALEASPSSDVLYNLAKIYDLKLKDRELAMKFYRRYIADPGAQPDRVRAANARLAELRELELAASEPPPTPTSTPAPAPKKKASDSEQRRLPDSESGSGLTGMQVAGLVTGLAGLGGVALGTVFGLSAKSDTDVAKQDCDGNDCTTQRGVDAAKDAASKATISTVSFVAGGSLAALGTILLISGSRPPAERDSAGVELVPFAAPGSVGTHVSGRF